jgi:hypothetical protein
MGGVEQCRCKSMSSITGMLLGAHPVSCAKKPWFRRRTVFEIGK